MKGPFGVARKLLRTLVLKTNPYFPFTYVNRWPYYAALKAVTKAFQKNESVLALYLGRSLASDAWIPGLSDIDLTLILKSGLSTDAEFNLVDSLWSDYRRLTRYFPMLGELLILGAGDLKLWLRGSCESPGGRAWTLLYGEPLYDSEVDHSPDWRRRCLDFAMWVYLDLVPPCLALPDSFVLREDLLRRVRKIFRVLQPVLGEDPVFDAPPLDGDPGTVAARAALALESAVLRLKDTCAADHDPPPSLVSGNCRFHLDPSHRLSGVRSAMRFRGAIVLVMEDGTRAEEYAASMGAARSFWGVPPLPLPRKVFEYMVRQYDPYTYEELRRNREILYGVDPLDMAPPRNRDIAAYRLAHIDHTLTFPRSEWLFSDNFPSDDALQIAFGGIMTVHLIVSKNWVSPVRRDVDAQARREYPESVQALHEATRLSRSDPAAARRKIFALFLSLTDAVRDRVAAAPELPVT